MYGQLTAIAREFNFPTITGLCLYLHFSDNGISTTPRLSDESWTSLWGHLFEAHAHPVGMQLPIVGRLEFDIDLIRARWYVPWLTSSQRERGERQVPSSSQAPSTRHGRPDSRSTLAEHRTDDEEELTPQNNPGSQFGGRHMPRKLSLLGRLDLLDPSGVNTTHRFTSSVVARPLKLEEPVPEAFVPTPPEEPEVPKAAQSAKEKVESWRASASLGATPLAALGQTSLEPANMPNRLPLDHITVAEPGAVDSDAELRLEDYTWSISSAGPPSYPGSPASNVMRLPSPDISRRMMEDCPCTPSTATSWGAPSSFPPSPTSDYQCPSIDIAQRHTFSMPATPSTATSWGPSSHISSYTTSDREASVDFAGRVGWSAPVTPTTATSWGAPLSYPPSPATPFYVQTPGIMDRVFDPSPPLPRQKFSFPYYSPWQAAPWSHVWPYTHTPSRKNSQKPTLVSEERQMQGLDKSLPRLSAVPVSPTTRGVELGEYYHLRLHS
jgi:hypothetical protein